MISKRSRLVIVESPTKAKTMAKFLGQDYLVKSSYGHIRDLPEKSLGVDLKHNFQPKYIIPKKARPIVAELKKAAQKSRLVILATDEDREGEAIAWHLAQVLGLKNFLSANSSSGNSFYQRITFHEITQKAIQEALKNPRPLNIDLVNAQQARRILDRLVGYKLSPFLWVKVAKGLSAGRVQSVAVRLIVDREREIEKFIPQEYWTITAELKKPPHSPFSAQLIKIENKTIKPGLKDKAEVEKILPELKKATYQVKRLIRKETKKHPLAPFTTSTLQQTAARKFGFSAKQTMFLAQQLYEGIDLGPEGSIGLITYMRTDSVHLSPEAVSQARQFIEKKFGSNYLPEKPKVYQTKTKKAQEAHEAIRPTDVFRTPESIKKHLNKNQAKLYQLIWQRFIACQMKEALFDSTTVDILANNKYLFRATGSILKFDGWLKVYPIGFKETLLPLLTENDSLKLIKLIPQQHFTQPPARYSEASLVKTLEEYGIGRPSTYAPIISTIQERGYVKKNEQKKFYPTEMGILVNDLLVKHFPEIVDIQFTARMEDDLDKIAAGQENWVEVVRHFYQPFEKRLYQKYQEVKKQSLVEKTDKICPQCGHPLVIRWGKFGKFYACSNFPHCRFTQPYLETTGRTCPQCQKGEIVKRKNKKGQIFYGCSRYPECDYIENSSKLKNQR